MKKNNILLILLFLNSLSLLSQNSLGLYWNGTNEVFASLDVSSGVFTDIATLPNVQTILSSSTFDEANNRYAIETNLGITIIDAANGTIINTFPNSAGWTGMEFNSNNNLTGVYWNGTNEIFTSLNISSGIFTDIATLPNVQTILTLSTFDEANNRYAIETNLGITIIDAANGTIINTFPNSAGWTGMEFNSNNNLTGVYWNGTNEIFTSLNISSGIFTDIATLPNVQTILTLSTFDEANNRYAIETNLGITIIDAANGTVINTFPNSVGWTGMEYEDLTPLSVIEYSFLTFQVYPNPTNDIIKISTVNNLGISYLEIVNNLGQVIFTKKYPGLKEISISLNGYNSGLYFLKINKGFETIRIIKN